MNFYSSKFSHAQNFLTCISFLMSMLSPKNKKTKSSNFSFIFPLIHTEQFGWEFQKIIFYRVHRLWNEIFRKIRYNLPCYYYRGNVYTTSCKKKSKPEEETRGKIKLFRSQNVMFQRNLSRIRREIIWNRKKKIARGVVHINFGGKFQVGPF